MRRLLALASLPLLLNACAGALITTGTQAGVAIAENRSIGRKVDDTVIYTDLTNQFIQANQAALLRRVTFNVRYSRVMLTGNVLNDDESQRAVALAWKAKGVSEVINELNIVPDSSYYTVAEDALIKRNLESRLLITKGVWVINYSIDVTNATAYLIGRVKDQAELDRALNVARTTRGIKRVVSHLQINPDTSHITTQDGNVSGNYNDSSSGNSNYTPPPVNNSPSSNYSAPSVPASNSGSGDVYTGPVYSGGSISSSPN
ncbi:MAG: BON domain-containing protein [Rickettsiales bacterium]